MQHPSKPNLFVIGAMKSGTSSLHDYLNAHPDILMSDVKEPCHFAPELNRTKGLQWYLDLFSEGNNCKYRGESSVVYTHLPDLEGVPKRIADFTQNAKFLFLMRDPIERSISHYWHRVRSYRVVERRDMLTAFREESLYFNYSDYAMQLEPYLQLFGPANVLATTFEAMRDDRYETMKTIFRFLDVPTDALPAEVFQTRRHTTPKVVKQKIGWMHQFRHSKFWNQVGPLVPKSIRSVGKRVSEPSSIDRDKTDASAAIAYARESLAPRLDRLDSLLEVDRSAWTTLCPTQNSDQTGGVET